VPIPVAPNPEASTATPAIASRRSLRCRKKPLSQLSFSLFLPFPIYKGIKELLPELYAFLMIDSFITRLQSLTHLLQTVGIF